MWFGDAEMVEAFYGFASEIQRIEKEIEKRNRDMSLKNRCGAGVLPYELLAPSSKPCFSMKVQFIPVKRRRYGVYSDRSLNTMTHIVIKGIHVTDKGQWSLMKFNELALQRG
ncbi:linoleate 13S-lipoxygenase 3-1, chloroplastic-like protein [Tanacetum coccineum]